MIELWKDIPGYVGYYQASDLGRIKGLPRNCHNSVSNYQVKGRVVKQHPGGKMGYMGVSLCRNSKPRTFRVHVLVALTFLGERPEGYHVGHLDGNPKNNEAKNLRYLTVRENIHQSYKDSQLNAHRNHGKLFEYNGESLSLSQWSERLGCNKWLLQSRKQAGWSIEKMLTHPFPKPSYNPSGDVQIGRGG